MMFTTVLSVAALIASAAAQASDPIVQSPASLTQCQRTLLQFSGTNSPFTLSALPGGQAGAQPIEEIAVVTGTTYSWLVNIAAGVNVTIQISDSQGAKNYAAPLVILSSSDASCVGVTPTDSGAPTSTVAGSSSSAPGSSVAASTTPAGSSTAAASSSAAASSTKAASSSVASTSAKASSAASGSSVASGSASSASPSATQKSSASTLAVQLGAAGVVGLIGVAALF